MGCCWRDRAGLSELHDRSLGALLFVLFPSAVSQLVSAINGDFTNRPSLGAATDAEEEEKERKQAAARSYNTTFTL